MPSSKKPSKRTPTKTDRTPTRAATQRSGARKASGPARDPSQTRLQKVMADAGIGSRRACEEMIESGRVKVNGVRRTEMPVLVDPATDQIEVEGELLMLSRRVLRGARAEAADIAAEGRESGRRIYVMLYKPRQTVTTLSDPEGRRTVADIVRHPSGARLYPVGRLDYDTMGLLLMTNDGELANRLTHPSYGVHKSYRAVVKGALTSEEVQKLEKGVFLADRREGKSRGVSRTAGATLTIAKNDPTRTILDITLNEGRNRQVRRMLAKAGCPVKKLVRMQMGPLKLKGVALGQWRELTLQEVQSLRKAAGMTASGLPSKKPATPAKPVKKKTRARAEPAAGRVSRSAPKRKGA